MLFYVRTIFNKQIKSLTVKSYLKSRKFKEFKQKNCNVTDFIREKSKKVEKISKKSRENSTHSNKKKAMSQPLLRAMSQLLFIQLTFFFCRARWLLRMRYPGRGLELQGLLQQRLLVPLLQAMFP